MLRILPFFLALIGCQLCFSQNWEADYATAKEKAQAGDKRLLLVFSGSDWCVPCMKLERNIWQSEAFTMYAEKELVLYRADFPQKKKNKLPEAILNTNKALAEQYNTKGYFPLVVLLDAEGKAIGHLGYENITAEQYIKKIAALQP